VTKPAQPERRGFFSFLRHPFSRPKPKPIEPDPDLRHRVCLKGNCPEPPKPVEPDLRHRVCLQGPCAPCPPGEVRGKNGVCGGTTTQSAYRNTYLDQCEYGGLWNVAGCGLRRHCPPGEIWNGSVCIPEEDDCAGFISRAETLANQIRGVKSRMQMDCSGNPPAQDCDELKQQYDGAVMRYRMLQNEAPIACRTRLQDPLSF